MESPLPPQLASERDALLTKIEQAFAGVGREGGVSWSEAEVIDAYGSEEERAAARALDTEASWRQLVDDPEWNPEAGVGGFCFLDPIGFRYYLPAAMIRCLRSSQDEGVAFHLWIGRANGDESQLEYTLWQWSALDGRQRRCVRRFLRYMVEFGEHRLLAWADEKPSWVEILREEFVGDWQRALDGYWETAEEDA